MINKQEDRGNKKMEKLEITQELPMTLKRSQPRGMRVGTGFILYGSDPHNKELFLDGTPTAYGQWVEKWFATADKAIAYCDKKNWEYKLEGETK